MIRNVRSRVRAFAMVRALLVVLLLGACGPTTRMVMPASRGVAIGTVSLKWSQVHAVFGEHVLLVDSGADGDFDEIKAGLDQLGVKLADIKCAVITHGHADHAGTARAFQLAGIKIIAGAADLERTRKGVHGPHHPTGVFARMLKWFLPDGYPAFTADVQVADRYDLAACGVRGEVIAMPGHTPGSVVVLVAGGTVALVGDQFRGGLAYPELAVEHFYQDDPELDHRQIKALLHRGVVWFVLGHGGPIERRDVIDEFGRD
jgi:hydroxyacylglutathione hydrolase